MLCFHGNSAHNSVQNFVKVNSDRAKKNTFRMSESPLIFFLEHWIMLWYGGELHGCPASVSSLPSFFSPGTTLLSVTAEPPE